MSSKAEQITAALHAALTTPPMTSVPAARVFRDLHGALASDEWPAILVETGNEPPPVRVTIGHKSRWVDVSVSVIAAAGFSATDAALVESFNRLSADPTLGGLAFEFEEMETIRAREMSSQDLAMVSKTYRYQFRTTEASLEA